MANNNGSDNIQHCFDDLPRVLTRGKLSLGARLEPNL